MKKSDPMRYQKSDKGPKHKKLRQKNKIEYPKDIQKMDQEEILEHDIWFEEFCGCCDFFPGIVGVDFRETSCPFLEKFRNCEFSAHTLWKEQGCNNFYD